MAGKDIRSQLNLSVNIKLGKSGLTQQLQAAVEKAVEAGMAKGASAGQAKIQQAVKKTAEVAAKEQIASEEKVRKQRAIAGRREYASAAKSATPVLRPSSPADLPQRRRNQLERMLKEGIQDEARQRFSPSATPAEIAAQMRRPGDIERFAAQRVRAQEQEQKDKVKESIKGAKESQKKTAGDDRAETKRAATEGRRLAREERQVFQAERQIARLDGAPDPRFGKLNALRPGLGDRLQRSERLSGLFPGSAGLARSTGMPLGLIRGGMALGPIAGGIASGNPMLGAGGGAMSGFMGGGLLGLGGMGSAALGGAGAIVGAIGAAVVMGIQRGFANVPAATQFRRAGMGALGVAPSQQGNIGVHRGALESMALSQAPIGMDPLEAIQIAATMQQAGGGWAGTAGSRSAIAEAMQLRQAFGVDAGVSGQLEMSRRRGGLRGSAGFGAGRVGTALAEGAVGLGFQGSEVGDLVGQLAGSTTQARGMGTFANLGSQMNTIGALSPMIGQMQGARVAGGLQGTLSNIATQGVAGAPNPAIGLMMMQAFGGLQLGKKGGVSAADIFSAQGRIEREGVTPQGVQRMMGFFQQAGGGSRGAQAMILQRGMAQMGLPMGPGLIESLQRGGPANADIAATITGAGEGQRELGALQRSGMGGRAAALAPLEMQRGARTQATDIQSGLIRAESSQLMDQASANLSVMTTNLGVVNDALNAFAGTLNALTIP